MPFSSRLLAALHLVSMLSACGAARDDDRRNEPDSSAGTSSSEAGSAPVAGSVSVAPSDGVGGTSGGLIEGARCTLRIAADCDSSCGAKCGTDPQCFDICCRDVAVEGVVCNGVCSESACAYTDHDDPACNDAVPTARGDVCSLKATVKGRVYELEATADASGYGAPELSDCLRTLANGNARAILSGIAPGYPCAGVCPTPCEWARSSWGACCGR